MLDGLDMTDFLLIGPFVDDRSRILTKFSLPRPVLTRFSIGFAWFPVSIFVPFPVDNRFDKFSSVLGFFYRVVSLDCAMVKIQVEI